MYEGQITKEYVVKKRMQVRQKYSHVPYHMLEDHFSEEIKKHTEVLEVLAGDLMDFHNFWFNNKNKSQMSTVLERAEATCNEVDQIKRKIIEYTEDAFILGFIGKEKFLYFTI